MSEQAPLTREAILAMKPGPEMDAAVAVYVLGWRTLDTTNAGHVLWHESMGIWGHPPAPFLDRAPDLARDWKNYVPEYSTNIADAWEVVGKIVHSPGLNDQGAKFWQLDSLGFTCCEHDEDGSHGVWRCVFGWGDSERSEFSTGPTASEAICKAALLSTVPA